jgi:predicted TIM-barrel fold metal-dependent hydrolase
MLSRRDLLKGAIALAFDVPAEACDCHTHIFGDPHRFPMVGRTYTPAPALVPQLQALHRALHISRVVVVQPSIYGTDNSCTLDAIKQLGPRARGIAVIDEQTSDAKLAEMDRAGIRGVRINLGTTGITDFTTARRRVQAAIDRLKSGQSKGRKWHIQIYTELSVIDRLADQVQDAPVPIVFDHFGGAQANPGVKQSGFNVLLRLVRQGSVYVKISAPYRCSTQAPDYADVAPLAQALIAENPRRILWGSDWPHPDTRKIADRPLTDVTPRFNVDDARILNQLAVWESDAGVRKTILVENPAKLYGF